MLNRLKRLRKRCAFAKYCFSHGSDERFVKEVKELQDNPELVLLEKYADEGPAEIYYHIFMEESQSGFFADHNRLLGYLYFADYYNMIPIVEYTDKYCYAEKGEIYGTNNPFEYYFLQPSEISLQEMQKKNTVVRSRKNNTKIDASFSVKGYEKSEDYLQAMADITAKYIRLQPRVESQIQKDWKSILPEKAEKGNILGCHVRGTDFKRNYNGHPVMVTIEEYADTVENLMKKDIYAGIFLATDDANAVKLFKKRFEDKVFFYSDVTRSEGNETVMKSKSERPNHHYELGFEVLRDMYSLSYCDGLVAGLSQVSFAARIQKKSTGREYSDLVILDKGINQHRNTNCIDDSRNNN